VVEDSAHGVAAARAAGMWAFGYAGGVTPASALEGPATTVFDDMQMLPRLLATIARDTRGRSENAE
jgi:beta-phosphoglucomutase-like phosphatase (HAD superfamily)